jgi:hypothetical protein
MKFPSTILLILVALSPTGFGQGNSNANNGQASQKRPLTGNPDADWTDISGRAKGTPLASATVDAKSPADKKPDVKRQTQNARDVAQNAKDFYTQYPNHPKASDARKLEAISALHGVEDGDPAQEQAALALAKAYRDNRSNRDGDRLDVALAAERVKVSASAKTRRTVPRTSEWEQMADTLRAEFGDQPQLHDYYARLARDGDMFTAKRIATNLSQWKVAAGVKAEAQTVLDRHALLGRPLNLTATGSDGSTIDFAQLKGSVTVVFLWPGAASPDVQNKLKRFRSSVPPGTNFVYLAIGGDQTKLAAAAANQPIRGRTCAVAAARIKPALDALKARDLPYLYVLNAKGLLAGFGPIDEFTNLLSLAHR